MSSDSAALLRENSRLVQQLKRMQSIVSTLRDEVADANAEIAASRRLFDEQKQILIQEVERERSWRESLAKQVSGSSKSPKVSVGTNTMMDNHTSTVADATTMTPTSPTPKKSRDLQLQARVSGRRRVSELQDFSDWLCRGANYHSRDLCALFEAMGASTPDEVCANVTEDDLVKSGIPLLKARSMMHLIMEQTAVLLSQRR